MKKKLRLISILAVTVLVLDHLTKWLIVRDVPMGVEIPVIPGFFDIVHGRNTGAAFGFLSAWHSPLKNWFFYGVGIAALIFLYQFTRTLKDNDKISLIAVGLVLGGALGNIIDRAIRGSVVDFVSFHYYDAVWTPSFFGYNFIVPLTWPAFNVADSAITVAVCLLLWQNLKALRKGEL